MKTLALLLLSLPALGQQAPAPAKPDPDAIVKALYVTTLKYVQAVTGTQVAMRNAESSPEVIKARNAETLALEANNVSINAYCALPEPRPAIDGIPLKCAPVPPTPPAPAPEKKP